MESINNISLPPQTQIVAVSKLQSAEKIRDLYGQGQRLFAENYVQEALPKMQQLSDLEITWHFIGSLQKNKVKFVVGAFELIHSVDSFSLAEAIAKVAGQKNIQQKILLQINLANEASKGGFQLTELDQALKQISELPQLLLVGFMTMPPLQQDAEKSRPYFVQLRKLKESYAKKYPQLTELSMGTSHDFKIAAQEGATLVRLGTILFGERPSPHLK